MGRESLDNQQQIIQRYFLGELTESEREELEQKYFNDPQFFAQMAHAETDLVDKYARGLLPPDVRERFEQYYLAHPRRRERANFADALATKVGENSPVSAVTPAQFEALWGRTTIWWGGPKLAWAFSLLLLFLAAGAVWLVVDSRRLRQERAQAEVQRAVQAQRERELQQQVAEQRRRAEQLSGASEHRHSEQTAPSPGSPTGNVAPAVATLVLTAGGVRSGETGPPAVLVVPAGTEQVRLQLNLNEAGYSGYSARLERAGGAEVSSWQHLTPKVSGSAASFTMNIPVQRFATGDYILTLKGATQSGEVEDVSKSIFHVEKK